jgi:hypothetical protein
LPTIVPTWLGVALVSQYQPVVALLFRSGSTTGDAAATVGAVVSIAVKSVVSDSSVARRRRSKSRPKARPSPSVTIILESPFTRRIPSAIRARPWMTGLRADLAGVSPPFGSS